MKTNPKEWILWDQSELLPYEAGVTLEVRSETPVTVTTTDGLLVGAGEYSCACEVTGDGKLTFKSESEVFIKPSARVQDRIAQSEETFTSLDRPAPLTPEMLAISRMLRQNEIQRERDRERMEKLYVDRSATAVRRKSETSSKAETSGKKEAVREDASRSDTDAEMPSDDRGGEDAETDGVLDRKPAGKGSAKGSD